MPFSSPACDFALRCHCDTVAWPSLLAVDLQLLRMRVGPQKADRLTLVSELKTSDGYALVLQEPAFIPLGAIYWTENNFLCIETSTGFLRCVGVWESRP